VRLTSVFCTSLGTDASTAASVIVLKKLDEGDSPVNPAAFWRASVHGDRSQFVRTLRKPLRNRYSSQPLKRSMFDKKGTTV
jgi:hypothetical protein